MPPRLPLRLSVLNIHNNVNTRLVLLNLSSKTKRSYGTTPTSGAIGRNTPLKILFCGSDHFSATSLNALYREHLNDKSFIESIEVVCRPPKPSARGLKSLKQVPILSIAESLNLPVHKLDTFTNWELPPTSPQYNLIVAVSFGKLIPARILSHAAFGGINVHPSLLPALRGAAPIYHALLSNHPFTGVSIQTLHPTLIDYGTILLQSEEIPIPEATPYAKLHDQLAVLGAHMLVHTCRERLFIQPYTPLDPRYPPSTAPKVTKEDAKINWSTMSAEDLERRAGALTKIWARLGAVGEMDRRKKAMFSHVEVWNGSGSTEPSYNNSAAEEGGEEGLAPPEPGTWKYIPGENGGEGAFVVRCKNGWIAPKGIQIEGQPVRNAAEWARSMQANSRNKKQVFT
ncbi:formyl transferase [Peziza echinospora]|nr:formyl transferase [Peziza echinospora]